MAKCMACGKTALLTTTFGKVVLCKNCGSVMNVSVWSGRDFESMDELIEQKKQAIQKSEEGNISKEIITEITRFFDEYINAGFVTTINGKSGQTLKVFANYCIINTKNESKRTELEDMFYEFEDDEGDEDDELLSYDDKQSLVRGLMTGKLVQAGIGVAVTAKLKEQEKEKAAEKKSRERQKNTSRLITVGERRVNLKDVSAVETYSQSNTTNGYLKFVPKGVSSTDLYMCEFFFFNNSKPFESKKIRQRVDEIKVMLNERIAGLEIEENKFRAERQAITQTEQLRKMVKEATQQNKADAFDEIRKFKQLYDEGIISDEEFNAKKKRIVGIIVKGECEISCALFFVN